MDSESENRGSPVRQAEVYFVESEEMEMIETLERLKEISQDVSLIVMDSVCKVQNTKAVFPLIKICHFSRLLITGLYSKRELAELGKLFGIPSRYQFSQNKELEKRIQYFSVSKDSDKAKALLSFLKQHLSGLSRSTGELNFVKEDSFKDLFPLVVLSDSKKERDKISDGSRKLGLKVTKIGEKTESSNEENGPDLSSKIVYVGNLSKVSFIKELEFKMIMVNGFPKSIEHLLSLVQFNGSKQHLFFTDKDFFNKRKGRLMSFIEPVCLLRLCKTMKRLSNVPTLNFKMDEEVDSAKKDIKKVDKLLKLRQAELLNLLNCSKSESLSWVVNKLKERNNFDLNYRCPMRLRVTFTIPNHDKKPQGVIKTILENSTLISGKYNLELLNICPELAPDTVKLLKTHRIMIEIETIQNILSSIKNVLNKINTLKETGVLTYEIIDELMFFEPKESMTDIEIYQIIAERKHEELMALKKVNSIFNKISSICCTLFLRAIHLEFWNSC